MKSWSLTCLSWISGSRGAPIWLEQSMQYEIHRSEVPSSLAGILHCFAALSCLFLCLRCLSWISGSGGAPTWFEENTQYEIHRSEVGRSFAGILHCFLLLELPFSPGAFLEQWFRNGSNLIATRRARWNPGVWGVCRGSMVPEGFQLDLRKTCNMKSTCACRGSVVLEGFQFDLLETTGSRIWRFTFSSHQQGIWTLMLDPWFSGLGTSYGF